MLGEAAVSYDGLAAEAIACRLRVPMAAVYDVVGSTMDVAHALAAAGAPGGTVALADMQLTGRGRQGRGWRSEAGRGVWVTLVERPRDVSGVEVLSLRTGLLIAEALEPLAPSAIHLKWPNDLHVEGGKLAGILIEARWREGRLDWVAIGVGLNVRPPTGGGGGALREEVTRIDALDRVVGAMRAAAATPGGLTASELARFQARDLSVGRRVVAPAPGIVAGVDASGAVVIVGADGTRAHRTGSLVFAEDA